MKRRMMRLSSTIRIVAMMPSDCTAGGGFLHMRSETNNHAYVVHPAKERDDAKTVPNGVTASTSLAAVLPLTSGGRQGRYPLPPKVVMKLIRVVGSRHEDRDCAIAVKNRVYYHEAVLLHAQTLPCPCS